jgi:hypothetical protein
MTRIFSISAFALFAVLAFTARPALAQIPVKVSNETEYDAEVYVDGQKVEDLDAGESKDISAPPGHMINACYYGEVVGGLLFGERQKKCMPPREVSSSGSMAYIIYPQ